MTKRRPRLGVLLRPDILQWYVIHTKPRQEDVAEAYLRELGLETFHPKLWVKRVVQGRLQRFIKPLFPGYLFAQFELRRSLRAVKYGRGVRQIVSTGNEPTPVDEEILEVIRGRMHDGYVTIEPRMEPGDRVMVESGPLRGFQGIFEREMKDSERVIILLETVRYQARVLLEKGELKRI